MSLPSQGNSFHTLQKTMNHEEMKTTGGPEQAMPSWHTVTGPVAAPPVAAPGRREAWEKERPLLLNFQGQSIYGRCRELSLLQETLQRVVSDNTETRNNGLPKPEIALVHGESGSGKSKLVRSFRDSVRLKEGGDLLFFVEGKFDQNVDSIRPYSAIVEAASQLCTSIGRSDCLDEIKKRVEDGRLSSEIAVLSKLIPAMEIITRDIVVAGEANPGRTSSNYGFMLFMDTFRSFISLVCEVAPVILFLDDIQWADEASQRLLSTIVHASNGNLFFIGAFRDDEIEATSVLSWLSDPKKATTAVDIAVGPLDETSVNKLVAALTDQRPEQTEDLSSLVGQKTGRNAYFVLQYMDDLQRHELLSFSFNSNQWQWDLEQIEAGTDVSDNVVTLLTKKINSMPTDVQQVLMVASCLGFVLDIDVLEQIVLVQGLLTSNTSNNAAASADEAVQPAEQEESLILPDDAALTATDLPIPYDITVQHTDAVSADEADECEQYRKAITQAITAGLIEKATGGKYKFSHDRVQQAAYSLMPDGAEGVLLHARLGDVLLQMSRTQDGEEWMFFAGVDLLSKFASHILDTESRVRLARLSLEAGTIAENKSAFIPATKYLKTGIELLDPADRWTAHYDLCLELHSKAAELGRTYGDFNSTLALVEETVAHARSFQDRLRVLSVKAYVLGGLCRLPEAIDACRDVLRELGVRFLTNPKPIHIMAEYAKTKLLLRGRTARDLQTSLLPLVEEKQLQRMQFLNSVALFAWHAGLQACGSFVFMRMMRITLKHGLCKFSPFAFATFGFSLAVFGDSNAGHEYGRVALDMLEDIEGARDCVAATSVVVESCLMHLKNPLYESLSPLLESHEVGMQTGEIEFAAVCLSQQSILSFYVGARLDGLEAAFTNHVSFFREYGQGMAEGLSAPWLQVTLCLLGKAADPLVLTGDGMNEEEFLKRHTTAGNQGLAVRTLHFAKMLLLYVFGELEAADKSRALWEEGAGIGGTIFMIYYATLFSGLVSLGLARKFPSKRRFYARRARPHIAMLEQLLKGGCVNAMLPLRFLEAELLSLKGETMKVKGAYDAAINLAARTGSLLIKATAYERVGRVMLERNEHVWAAVYLGQAVEQFTDYGATAKVEHLENDPSLWNSNSGRRASSTSFSPRGGTSAQLQPKAAATGIHRKINFSPGNTQESIGSERMRTRNSFTSATPRLSSRVGFNGSTNTGTPNSTK